MAESKKKYVVADGCSFVGNKKTYKQGDEIDESAFKSNDRFNQFVKQKKIIIALADDSKKEDKPDPITPERREQLEKIAADFLKPEEVKKLDNEQLIKLLKEKGKLN